MNMEKESDNSCTPHRITMEEAEEAMKNGLVVLFRNPGEPLRILNKEESEKLRRDTEEKKKRYEAFLNALSSPPPSA